MTQRPGGDVLAEPAPSDASWGGESGRRWGRWTGQQLRTTNAVPMCVAGFLARLGCIALLFE